MVTDPDLFRSASTDKNNNKHAIICDGVCGEMVGPRDSLMCDSCVEHECAEARDEERRFCEEDWVEKEEEFNQERDEWAREKTDLEEEVQELKSKIDGLEDEVYQAQELTKEIKRFLEYEQPDLKSVLEPILKRYLDN